MADSSRSGWGECFRKTRREGRMFLEELRLEGGLYELKTLTLN